MQNGSLLIEFTISQDKKGWEFTISQNKKGWEFTISQNKKDWEFTISQNEKGWEFTILQNQKGWEFTISQNKEGWSLIKSDFVLWAVRLAQLLDREPNLLIRNYLIVLTFCVFAVIMIILIRSWDFAGFYVEDEFIANQKQPLLVQLPPSSNFTPNFKLKWISPLFPTPSIIHFLKAEFQRYLDGEGWTFERHFTIFFVQTAYFDVSQLYTRQHLILQTKFGKGKHEQERSYYLIFLFINRSRS